MRDYAVLAPGFWTGKTGRAIRALGPEAQIVALYLISCPSSTMIGLYYIPLPTLCHETGSPIEGASKALRSLGEIGFCHFDADTEHIWIPEMAKWQIGEQLDPRDKRVTSVHRAIKSLVNSPFFNAFLDRYADAYHLADMKPLRRGIEAPSKPLRSQDQDQEQEHDHEQDQKDVSSERSRKTRDRSEPAAAEKRITRRNSKPTTEGTGETVAKILLADGTEASVTADLVAEWQKAFPGVDVLERLKFIRVYFLTNPQKRKTAAGIGKCITSWLERDQNSGRSPNTSAVRRDGSGAPLPKKSKTEIRDIVDGEEFMREEYNVETGEVIKRYPHPFRKKAQ